jgi:hypothetical protein
VFIAAVTNLTVVDVAGSAAQKVNARFVVVATLFAHSRVTPTGHGFGNRQR